MARGAGLLAVAARAAAEPQRQRAAAGRARRERARRSSARRSSAHRLDPAAPAPGGRSRAQQAPGALRQLAADEVERLDAVRALVDLRDARVAHELLDARLADVAVRRRTPAGRGWSPRTPRSVSAGLDDRRHQRDEVVRRRRRPRRDGVRDVDLARPPTAPARGRPRPATRMRSSVRRTSGWTMIGSASRSGRAGAGQRPALQPLAGVGGGALVAPPRPSAEALDADAEARRVHHREHRRACRGAARRSAPPTAPSKAITQVGGARGCPSCARSSTQATPLRRAVRRGAVRHGEQRDARACRPGASGSRASTRCRMSSVRSCSPAVMKIFWPEMR